MKEMKKLEDITYRHKLIERYLDADTSVEEEQALLISIAIARIRI